VCVITNDKLLVRIAHIICNHTLYEPGVSQSVAGLGYEMGGQGSIPGGGKDLFPILHCVYTGSGVYPASCPSRTVSPSPAINGERVKTTTHLHSYIRFHGLVIS